MVLRFEPNQGPESQLLFRVWYDGHIDAQKWTVRSGSAWSLANSYIAKTGKEDIDAISRLLSVETTKVDVSAATVKGWHASLFEFLGLSNSQLEKEAVVYRRRYKLYSVKPASNSMQSICSYSTRRICICSSTCAESCAFRGTGLSLHWRRLAIQRHRASRSR